jgi:hypothetical protein
MKDWNYQSCLPLTEQTALCGFDALCWFAQEDSAFTCMLPKRVSCVCEFVGK